MSDQKINGNVKRCRQALYEVEDFILAYLPDDEAAIKALDLLYNKTAEFNHGFRQRNNNRST